MMQHIDMYGEAWGVRVTDYSLAISVQGVDMPEPSITVRLPLARAKELAMFLRSELKKYEREHKADIAVSAKVLERLGLVGEDW